MGEAGSQEAVSMKSLDTFPPTVHDHTEMSDGVTLHTIDGDPGSDLEVYADGREMHRADAFDDEEGDDDD